MIPLLVAFLDAKIPHEFNLLVQNAIKSSKQKIPMSMRQDSYKPGDYHFENCQFRLLHTLTSSLSNDIKGHYVENEHIAIVKRKAYNLPNSYVYVDRNTQKIYNLNQEIAGDEKVCIYKVKTLSIFDVFTNFHITSKNSQSSGHTLIANLEDDLNTPKIHAISEGHYVGIGVKTNYSVNSSITFNNQIDLQITADLFISGVAHFKHDVNESAKPSNIKTKSDAQIISEIIQNSTYSFSLQGIDIKGHIKAYLEISDLPYNFSSSGSSEGISFVYNFVKHIKYTPYSLDETPWTGITII